MAYALASLWPPSVRRLRRGAPRLCAMLACSSHALSHTFRFSTLFALQENGFDEWFAEARVDRASAPLSLQ